MELKPNDAVKIVSTLNFCWTRKLRMSEDSVRARTAQLVGEFKTGIYFFYIEYVKGLAKCC